MEDEPPPSELIQINSGDYSYTFSKGMLAHLLVLRGMPLNDAYRLAKKLYTQLIKDGILELEEIELQERVEQLAIEMVGPEIAAEYSLVEKWHNSSFPLIILISGALGTKTRDFGKNIAEKLAIPRIISTSIITQILRKVVAHDLSPELHRESYDAYEDLKPMYSVLYDKTLVGFEEHAKFTSETITALVKRALIEGISLIIHGEHLLPRFLSEKLLNNPSILFVTLNETNEKKHYKRLAKMNKKSNQSIDDKYFTDIRKVHDYLVEEATKRKLNVINVKEEKHDELIYRQILDVLSNHFYNKKFAYNK